MSINRILHKPELDLTYEDIITLRKLVSLPENASSAKSGAYDLTCKVMKFKSEINVCKEKTAFEIQVKYVLNQVLLAIFIDFGSIYTNVTEEAIKQVCKQICCNATRADSDNKSILKRYYVKLW